jgi:preprotein translocase subunit SecG
MEESLYNFYNLFVNGNLLEDLYQEELLSPITWTAIGIAFVVAFAFYIWPFNKVSFSGLGSWLLMLGVSAVTLFVITLITCYQKAGQEIPRDEADSNQGTLFDQGVSVFLSYAFEMALLTAVIFFVISMIMKNFSKNAKHRPMLWPAK